MRLNRIEQHEGMNDILQLVDADGQPIEFDIGPAYDEDMNPLWRETTPEQKAKIDQIVGDIKVEYGRFMERIHPKADWWLSTQVGDNRRIVMPVRFSVPNPNDLPEDFTV